MHYVYWREKYMALGPTLQKMQLTVLKLFAVLTITMSICSYMVKDLKERKNAQ